MDANFLGQKLKQNYNQKMGMGKFAERLQQDERQNKVIQEQQPKSFIKSFNDRALSEASSSSASDNQEEEVKRVFEEQNNINDLSQDDQDGQLEERKGLFF